MKSLVSAVLASLGIGTAAHAAPPVTTVDARTIRFSMPTVAAEDIQFAKPTKESFEGAPQFHEDEWCQIEFLPYARLPEIKSKLSEYKAFEQRHRTPNGWTEIYARKLQRAPIFDSGVSTSVVASALRAKQLPAPILTTSSRPLGQVQDGFSMALTGSVLLYGQVRSSAPISLGALVERGGDDSQLVRAFAVLNKAHKLVLVDWRSQQVLVAVLPSGEVSVWRP